MLKKAASWFVSLITWAEMCAAFGLMERTQQLTSVEVTAGLVRLNKEWGSFGQIAVDVALVRDAGKLALLFGLRAYDSMQLASMLHVHGQLGRNLRFCYFDRQLNIAVTALGISVIA